MAEGRKGAVWNYPTLIPLLCHYYPGRFGYDALIERVCVLEARLHRLEEYLYVLGHLLAGDRQALDKLERLYSSRPPVASVPTVEEEIISMSPNVLLNYVNGISDIRSLMPMVKADKSKLPKFVVNIWLEDRASLIEQARDMGLALPAKYKGAEQ